MIKNFLIQVTQRELIIGENRSSIISTLFFPLEQEISVYLIVDSLSPSVIAHDLSRLIEKNMENPSSRFINRVCNKKSSTRFDSLEDHRSTLDPIFYFFHFFCSIFEYVWLNSRLEICCLKFLKIVQKFYRLNFFQPSLNRSRSYPPMFVRVDLNRLSSEVECDFFSSSNFSFILFRSEIWWTEKSSV